MYYKMLLSCKYKLEKIALHMKGNLISQCECNKTLSTVDVIFMLFLCYFYKNEFFLKIIITALLSDCQYVQLDIKIFGFFLLLLNS